MKRTPLRSQIAFSLLAYTLLVGVGVFSVGYLIHERLEHLVWESLVQIERRHVLDLHRAHPDEPLPNSGSLHVFFAPDSRADAVPMELRGLPPGLHDEIDIGAGTYIAHIERIDDEWLYLLINIGDLEDAESAWVGGLTVIAVLMALVLAGLSWWLAGRLMQPVSRLERDIARLRTPAPNSNRVAVDDGASAELADIAQAVNALMQRIEESQERERQFLAMASHELRTPLAIIGGASEVIGLRPVEAALARPLGRIRRAADSLERLVPLLQMLAKSPQPDRAEVENLLLLTLVQQICAELAEHAAQRAIEVRMVTTAPVCVAAHRATLHLVLTHVMLAMIERSDTGVLRVEVSPAAEVSVFDPGHGLPAERIGERFAARARADHSSGALSLPLLERLCHYWGWRLTWSEFDGALTVTLDLRSAIASA